MNFLEVPNFEKVFSSKLKKGDKLINTETDRLTAPGENYASTLLSIIATVQDEETGKDKKIYVVAKLPPTNEFMRRFLNSKVTFRHELGFYEKIVPCLQQFQKDQNFENTLSFIPRFYGGRLNQGSSDSLENDATILLENLKESGFSISDRNLGFDLESSKFILAKIAQLHGVSLALKTIRPDLFQEKLLPYLDKFRIFISDDNPDVLQLGVIVNITLDVSKEDEICALHLTEIKESLDKCVKNMLLPRNSSEFTHSKFATFIHSDLWVNNIMVKKHMNKIQDVKFIDWQLYEYGSVVIDVLFTIFTSVQTEVLTKYLDELILFYYRELVKNLEKMKCEKFFSFSEFQEEMRNVAANISFFRILMAFPAVFAGDMTFDSEDLDKKNLLNLMQVSQKCKERILLTTRKFIKKGWL